jgi:UDP-N-acetylmuramoylalanine-D-glutamate ligase
MKSKLKKPVAIIGYSGHSYVIIDILLSAGRLVTAYCDQEEKEFNPYHLQYLGKESDVTNKLKRFDYFACVGHNNCIRTWATLSMRYIRARLYPVP